MTTIKIEGDFCAEIRGLLMEKIRMRIKAEVSPKVDAIVDQEVAAFALSFSKEMNIRTLGDALIIEIRKT